MSCYYEADDHGICHGWATRGASLRVLVDMSLIDGEGHAYVVTCTVVLWLCMDGG